MSTFLLRVADAFRVENRHVVGPGIGATAALFAAVLLPGRLRSLVVGSDCIASHSSSVAR
jgi:pimeloyl-ACP methyl ester carboxylesterase